MSKALSYKKTNLNEGDERQAVRGFCDEYIDFLNSCKTERKCTSFFENAAKAAGFKELDFAAPLKEGDKFYIVNRGKSIFLGVMGSRPVSEGVHIVTAHIDSPRLDLKPCPVCEMDGLGFLKTHYYGGIKKYQWTALPLAMYGVAVLKDGSVVEIEDDSLTFCITDLLPHLSTEQSEKKVSKAIEGEDLKILAASKPYAEGENENKVKETILNILNERFKITERELVSAEISFVPKVEAASVGFDNSMVGAYGQDDRVCAYTAFKAIMDAKAPQYTALVCLVDKEEIGSDGVTGMQSTFFDMVMDKISGEHNPYLVNYNSRCLSADVNAAFDPIYPSVLDKQNACWLGCGPSVTKYTGSRGKAGTSDACAETVGYFINLFDNHQIVWQTGQLGKVDMGGGGTVAKYTANRNIATVDIGVGLLSMHSPYEIAAKADVYETYRAFKTFLEN